jgi:tetratricopeptide (TPR) repeat protein
MLSESGTSANLPETVQALIAARLDTLSPDLKGLLQDASVLGKVFWTGALEAMGSRDRDAVLSGLRELVRREFVRPARVSSMREEGEFSFWHALVRDVAYQQIPRAARGQKHVQAAKWIESASEGRLSDHAEFLAHHYAQALELGRAAGDLTDGDGLRDRFVRFSVLAGDRAMSLDIPAAETPYRKALALMAPGVERAEVLVKLGDALQPQGRLLEAEEAYEEAIPELLAAGESVSAGRAHMQLSRALWRHGRTQRAAEVSIETVGLLESAPVPDLVLAYGRHAALCVFRGRPEEAIEWANKGMELAREIEFVDVTRALGMRGLARIDLGDPEGLDDLRAATDLALELNLPVDSTAISMGNLGEIMILSEGIAAGRAQEEASLEYARSRGHAHHVMYMRCNLLTALFHEGRWDELVAEADELIEWDRERGGTQLELWALSTYATALVHRGHETRATNLLSEALPKARDVADHQTVLPLLLSAAVAAVARGDLEAAEALLAEFDASSTGSRFGVDSELRVWLGLVAVATEGSVGGERVLGGAEPWSSCGQHALTHVRALVAEASGSAGEAAGLFAKAAEGWRAWGSVPLRAYALIGLGGCGDPTALAEGEAIFARLGATPIGAPTESVHRQQA